MQDINTVDRQGPLSSGLGPGLVHYGDVRPRELQEHVDQMFPAGLSSHGERDFLKNSMLARVADPAIEPLFEYVRLGQLRETPSRLP